MWPFSRTTRPSGDRWGLMPLLPEPEPTKPPRGFRFASNPPSMDELVRVENDHPYREVRTGQVVVRTRSITDRREVERGLVIGRMGSRDPRANHRGPHPSDPDHPEGYPGLYVQFQGSGRRWIPCQLVFVENDGRIVYAY